MGSLIELNRNRSNSAPASPGAAARNHPIARARNHEDESWKSLLVLVLVFTATAIAMSVSVVLAGSNTWAEAVPLIVFVVVFALTKIFLANALFYVMIRSDAHSESVAAKRAVHNKANGLVIRRPRVLPGFNRLTIAGARPRMSSSASKSTSASKVRLAILTRKPATPPPRRTDH
jgi:membrane glycosyltransferase